MVSRVAIHPKARTEISMALEYYHDISPELSADLHEKFQEAVLHIAAHYKLYQPIRGQYRKVNLERFPYKLVFRVKGDTMVIVALAHHKRKPGYWRKRK